MKTALVIPIYNRPAYVKQCFESLLNLTVKPDIIVLVDDASTDVDLKEAFAHFRKNIGCQTIGLYNDTNQGVRYSLQKGIEYAFNEEGATLVINLDSDAVVKPNFIAEMIRLSDFGTIATGFNNGKNEIIKELRGNIQAKFCNGINMAFGIVMYEKYIRPSLLKEGNWDYNTSLACQADNLPFIISKPSVVQHIGVISSMGHNDRPDHAQDFKMISLPNVTLFGIDSYDVEGIKRAAEISQWDIEFGAVNIITDNLFAGTQKEARRQQYSRFMIKNLTEHFTTSHVLTIHADGYVLNWKAWDDDFLQYDFIGGTWAYKDNKNVGNGGFSLRSKKLCDILAENEIEEGLMHPEDHCICRTYRKSLEDKCGIKFAPEEVANRFSIEAYGSAAFVGGNKYNGQFGFHSTHVDFAGADLPKDILYNPRPQLGSRVNSARVEPRNNAISWRR